MCDFTLMIISLFSTQKKKKVLAPLMSYLIDKILNNVKFIQYITEFNYICIVYKNSQR